MVPNGQDLHSSVALSIPTVAAPQPRYPWLDCAEIILAWLVWADVARAERRRSSCETDTVAFVDIAAGAQHLEVLRVTLGIC